MSNAKNFAAITDPLLAKLKGALRRMAITATHGAIWRLAGYRMPNGTTETMPAEVFSGIGFFARPPKGADAEAAVVNIGGATAPVIVATRDEATRRAVAGAIADDETAVHNSKAIMIIKADGTIEARSPGGIAQPLATLADVQALRDYVANLLVGGSGSAAAPPGLVPTPTGTTKLKGE